MSTTGRGSEGVRRRSDSNASGTATSGFASIVFDVVAGLTFVMQVWKSQRRREVSKLSSESHVQQG